MEDYKVLNIKGLEYKIFKNGIIIGKSGKVLSQRLDVDGYPTVTVGLINKRGIIRVHKLVAMAFLEFPTDIEETVDVDHIDNDRTNNHISI